MSIEEFRALIKTNTKRKMQTSIDAKRKIKGHKYCYLNVMCECAHDVRVYSSRSTLIESFDLRTESGQERFNHWMYPESK